MKEIKTNALILRCSEYGESDRIVTLLSEDIGKVCGIAKGARRSIKRFGGCLEPFSVVSLVVKERKGLSLIQEGKVLKTFRDIKEDIEKFSYGSYMLELADALFAEGGEEVGGMAFRLLLSGLETLAVCTGHERTVREYEIRILSMAGYMPSLLICISCGVKVERERTTVSTIAFSQSRGGVVCAHCRDKGERGYDYLSLGTLKTLEAAAAGTVSFTSHALEESGRIMPAFIVNRLGRRLNSLDFLEKIKIGTDR